MRTSRSLHLTALMTSVFAVFVLAIGERDPLLAILAVVFCGFGFVLKEFYGKHLNTFWGNLAALAALVVALWNLDFVRPEMRLIAMANLLVYAQFVLFYRERNPHTYWMMLLLSLLQVCVASVLINNFYLAFLLLGYMLLATRMIIQLTYRRECFEATKGKIARNRFSLRRRKGPRAVAPQQLKEPVEAPVGRRMRWALATQPATFSARLSKKAERHEYRGFGMHWVWMCFITLVLVPVVFAALPRPFADGGLIGGDVGGVNSVGFDEQVTLGEIGMILESNEEVMRVSFRTPNGTPFQLTDGMPLLRGVSYSTYSDAQWQRAGRGASTTVRQLDSQIPTNQWTMQEVSIVPDNHRFLFGVYPVYHAFGEETARNVQWDPGLRAMVRQPNQSQLLTYTSRTTGIQNGRMMEFVDVQSTDDPSLRELLDFPVNELPELKRAADGVIAAMPSTSSSDNIAKARALENYLNDSSRFQYTLQAPTRDTSIDPIEDFIVNNPQGHCEYFATALTLMLRSQAVPARMVNGYKGGDWNNLGQFYQVRQLHAHVWVEALVDDPNYTGTGTPPKKWMILDPTPAANVQATMWGSFRQFTDYVQHMWSSYVLGMNRDNQTQDIYGELFDASAWRDFIDQMKRAFTGQATVTGFFNIRLIVTVMVLPLFLFGFWRSSRNIIRWVRKRGAGKKAKRAAQAQVEFYRRFETIMAQRRILRDAAQTQREFAMAIGGQFSADAGTRGIAAIPKHVVDAFYRVRFGAKQLATDELSRIGKELDRIEKEMARSNGKHPPSNGHPTPA